MFVVISQMNIEDMINEDPIYFGRPPNADDKENIFIVRVACSYTDENGEEKNCYEFPLGNGKFLGNECDDFVRLDLLSRLIHTLLTETDVQIFQESDVQTSQNPKLKFFLVSNDKYTNWEIIDKKIKSRFKMRNPPRPDDKKMA